MMPSAMEVHEMIDQPIESIEQGEPLEEHERVSLYYQQSLSDIAAELEALRAGAEHLQALYGDAAVSSDLTFIKILEDRYESLIGEIREFREAVADVRTNLTAGEEEATGDGR